MEIFIWVIIFVISIVVLVKSADYFTDSAEKIGLFFGLSPFIIGVTIVSIGTSLPELAAGIVAAFKGGEATSLVLANIIGSNITNILLILGIGAIVGRFIKVRKDLVKLDLPLLSLATVLFMLFIAWDRVLTSLEALVLFAG
ncbi:sodium:calcium antiporter, partial [Patescibacteria group bacterium]|nr:sodium:calcium antiporter [Patescibacteria group bacterium]